MSCPGHCCSQNLINVCGHDVWLIATGLGIDPTSFLAFARMDGESPYHFKLDISGAAYCAVLNMREQPDGSRRCIFLMELPGGQTRCGIYSLRSVACRAYPLALSEGGVEVKPWAMCPDPWPALCTQEVASWQAELERHDMEFSIYALMVAIWNRKTAEQPAGDLDFRPFLDFLMDAYERLEPARRAVPSASWPRIWKRWRRSTANGLNPASMAPDKAADEPAWTHWLRAIRMATADAAARVDTRRAEHPRLCEETLV